MKSGNLYSKIPVDLTNEFLEVLTEGEGRIRVERIVSRQHASPPDFWYDQDSTEWILLMSGSAILQFAERDKTTKMIPGDWMEIAPHEKHRVERTSESEDTVWLAIHWE